MNLFFLLPTLFVGLTYFFSNSRTNAPAACCV
jgi:hypothetical protein